MTERFSAAISMASSIALKCPPVGLERLRDPGQDHAEGGPAVPGQLEDLQTGPSAYRLALVINSPGPRRRGTGARLVVGLDHRVNIGRVQQRDAARHPLAGGQHEQAVAARPGQALLADPGQRGQEVVLGEPVDVVRVAGQNRAVRRRAAHAGGAHVGADDAVYGSTSRPPVEPTARQDGRGGLADPGPAGDRRSGSGARCVRSWPRRRRRSRREGESRRSTCAGSSARLPAGVRRPACAAPRGRRGHSPAVPAWAPRGYRGGRAQAEPQRRRERRPAARPRCPEGDCGCWKAGSPGAAIGAAWTCAPWEPRRWILPGRRRGRRAGASSAAGRGRVRTFKEFPAENRHHLSLRPQSPSAMTTLTNRLYVAYG